MSVVETVTAKLPKQLKFVTFTQMIGLRRKPRNSLRH